MNPGRTQGAVGYEFQSFQFKLSTNNVTKFGDLATEHPYTISFLLDFIWLILIKNAFGRTQGAVG